MTEPAVRLVINRDQFRRLVAGYEVSFSTSGRRISVALNLESGSSEFGKFTDPPEAGEYYQNRREKQR